MIRFGTTKEELKQFLKSTGDVWCFTPAYLHPPRTIKMNVKYAPPGIAGDVYQVILFRLGYKKLENVENFNCVLLQPPHYVEAVYENRFYGLVGKQFEGSPYTHMLEYMQANPYEHWGQYCKDVFDNENTWKVNKYQASIAQR